MSRIATKSSISPKLYRHFAVATLVITALLGFFADGENREAAAESLVAPSRPAPEKKIAKTAAFRDGRKSRSWGSDAGGGGGGGGEGFAGGAEYGPGIRRPEHVQPPVPMSPAMQLTSLANLPDTAPPGMPQNVFEQLKRQQKRMREAGPQVTTQKDMARMTEQSRARSGGSDDISVEQAD